MKKIAAILLMSSVLISTGSGIAQAKSDPICTSVSRDAEVPSGSTADANGRTWVGFKAGGVPPDSLSKSSTATVCEDYPEPPPP